MSLENKLKHNYIKNSEAELKKPVEIFSFGIALNLEDRKLMPVLTTLEVSNFVFLFQSETENL